jgi:hypothetical protein
MMPSPRERLIGLIFLLLVLIFFLNRQGEKPSDNKTADNKIADNKIDSLQIEKPDTSSLPTASVKKATIKKANTVPIIKSILLLPIPVSAGQSLRAEVVSFDQDGDFVHLLYEWRVNGNPVLANDRDTLNGDQVHSGDKILVFVTPADPYSQGLVMVSPLTIVSNLSPEIVSLPTNEDNKGRYTYQIVAKDKDSDPLNYTLLEGPPGMEVNAITGLVQWAVVPVSESQSRVALEVSDGKGGTVTQRFKLKIITK